MKVKAIRVSQPLGDFYLASLDSSFLLSVSHSKSADYEKGSISGNQRAIESKRVKEIGSYINTYNAAFPNSIILSANYHNTDKLEVDDDKRWAVECIEGDLYELTIPNESLKICSIIDGQHRINGFRSTTQSMSLPCSVYIDLPPSLQAYVFSTINFNQQKVDKSLAYQLFGYQLDESESKRWSPDILGVKLSRVFNGKGVFKNKIKLMRQQKSSDDVSWEISSAVFIEGVVSQISGNPKKDKYIVNKKKISGYGSRDDLDSNDKLPLRQFYIDGNDKAIQIVIERYFESLQKYLWKGKGNDSIIFRSVGIAAQFSFLKLILVNNKLELNNDIDFENLVSNFSAIKFDSDYFSARSATKRRIIDVFKLNSKLITADELKIKEDDLRKIKEAAGLAD